MTRKFGKVENMAKYYRCFFCLAMLTALGWIMNARDVYAAFSYDIAYIWHNEMDTVLDYMEEIEETLGPVISKKLLVVVGENGKFGLIYDVNYPRTDMARESVIRQNRLLKAAGLDHAAFMRDEGYEPVYNISYGKGSNLEALKKAFDIVYSQLGKGVGKSLVIENAGDGEFTLVYKRYVGRDSGKQIARNHNRLLAKTDLRATLGARGPLADITLEKNNEAVFGESSHLDDATEEKSDQPATIPKKAPTETRTVQDLERKIESYLRTKRLSDERMAWVVYDFDRDEKLVSINEDVPLQAASMIKPFVALAYFHRVKEGKLKYDAVARSHMKRMIQKSDNGSTNWVMGRLGGPEAIDALLKREYDSIFIDIRIVEYIAPGGKTYRNKASAHDYSRFLYALWNVSLPHSRELRRLMALPNRDRIYTGIRQIPPGTLVYDKTGSTSRLCGNMGIISAKDRRGKRHAYSIIAIIEKGKTAKDYGRWISSRGNMIRQVSNVVYQYLKARYNLI